MIFDNKSDDLFTKTNKNVLMRKESLENLILKGHIENKREVVHNLLNEMVLMVGRTNTRRDSKKINFSKSYKR